MIPAFLNLIHALTEFLGIMGREFLSLSFGTKIMILFPILWMGFTLDKIERNWK